MNRQDFRQRFATSKPVILPVIHVVDAKQTITNIQRAIDGGCKGVFLINHDFGVAEFLPIIHEARGAFPDFWIGINFLSVTGKAAFPKLAELEKSGTPVNAYWGDDARINEANSPDNQPEAQEMLDVKQQVGWDGIYFGGTAFKKQREVAQKDYDISASIACQYMDVVTTSGIATGKAADTNKIERFRAACGSKPLALASGITPENIVHYGQFIDCAMVATGINAEGDFYNIDPNRLKQLMDRLKGLPDEE